LLTVHRFLLHQLQFSRHDMASVSCLGLHQTLQREAMYSVCSKRTRGERNFLFRNGGFSPERRGKEEFHAKAQRRQDVAFAAKPLAIATSPLAEPLNEKAASPPARPLGAFAPLRDKSIHHARRPHLPCQLAPPVGGDGDLDDRF